MKHIKTICRSTNVLACLFGSKVLLKSFWFLKMKFLCLSKYITFELVKQSVRIQIFFYVSDRQWLEKNVLLEEFASFLSKSFQVHLDYHRIKFTFE